jgi:peptide/nickel transport system substrate-binding protein
MRAVRRRGVLGGIGAAAVLGAPARVRAASTTTLRFVPQTDLTGLDPVVSTGYVTRNHGYMVFDTLYGFNADLRPEPQMVAGHRVEQDGLLWTLTLRDGLIWHDGEKVLARDCVASVRRWAKRDPFGATLLSTTAELSAPDDRTIQFRLKMPFPMLPDALGKTGTPMCAMMPERLANTDPFQQVAEMVGSGPYRFKADERIPGAHNAYERFDRYVPRPDGVANWTVGPKIVHYDRVEWNTLPDVATATSALQAGEQDWLAYVSPDMIELLSTVHDVRVARLDSTGMVNFLQVNHLQAPFNNPAIRRALMGAIDQVAYMQSIVGMDPSAYHTPLGYFCPSTPMASDAGLEVLTTPRDVEKIRAALKTAGYAGEKVVLLVPSDNPPLSALGNVAADMLGRVGMNVDAQAMDYGTMLARRLRKEPVEKGGWSAFVNGSGGLDWLNPGWDSVIRGNGEAGYPGWSTSARREELRQSWLDSPTLAGQQAVAAELQRQCFSDVPFYPLGQYFQSVAYRTSIAGVLNGFPVFWNVHPA